jgi:hypothetical protein
MGFGSQDMGRVAWVKGMRAGAVVLASLGALGKQSLASTSHSEILNFPSTFPITASLSSGLPFIQINSRTSGAQQIGMSFSREGFPLDTAFIGAARNGIALSPFRFSTQGGDLIVNFSRPMNRFSVRMGDFGADTPDRLSLRAYAGTNGTGPLISETISSLPTMPPGSQQWSDRQLSIRGTGMQSVRMIGGTNPFPNSVYYNNFIVTFDVPSVADLQLTKAALSAYAVSDSLYGDAAAATAVAATAVKFGLPLCALATPPSIAACGASIAAIGLAAYLNGKNLYDIPQILRDPPRFDYLSTSDLRPPPFISPIFTGNLANNDKVLLEKTLSNFAESRHLYDVWLTTLERFQGAEIDGNSTAMNLQHALLESIIHRLSIITAENNMYMRYWIDRIESDIGVVAIEQSEMARIFEEISRAGLPHHIRDMLTNFGYSVAEINQIEAELQLNYIVSDILVGASFNDIISRSQNLIDQLSCLSNGCFVYHNTLGVNPQNTHLDLYYYNFESDGVISVFIADQIFRQLQVVPSNELGPNRAQIPLDISILSLPFASVSIFNGSGIPLVISRAAFVSSPISDPISVRLPPSIWAFAVALVLLRLASSRHNKAP